MHFYYNLERLEHELLTFDKLSAKFITRGVDSYSWADIYHIRVCIVGKEVLAAPHLPREGKNL